MTFRRWIYISLAKIVGPIYLKSVASYFLSVVGLCQECMVSEPQVNAGARTVEPSTSLPVIDAEPILPEPGDNTAGASDPTNNIHGKGKKRRRASSGTVNSESCNLMAPSRGEI